MSVQVHFNIAKMSVYLVSNLFSYYTKMSNYIAFRFISSVEICYLALAFVAPTV